MTLGTRIEKKGRIHDTYKALMNMYIIRPIHDDAAYEDALEVAYRFIKMENLNSDQKDYFDLLTEQIQKYEREQYAIDTGENDPIQNIKSLMEDHDMNASDLGRLLGSPELGSRILNRKRDLSKKHIQILSERFSLDPSYFFPTPHRRSGV